MMTLTFNGLVVSRWVTQEKGVKALTCLLPSKRQHGQPPLLAELAFCGSYLPTKAEFCCGSFLEGRIENPEIRAATLYFECSQEQIAPVTDSDRKIACMRAVLDDLEDLVLTGHVTIPPFKEILPLQKCLEAFKVRLAPSRTFFCRRGIDSRVHGLVGGNNLIQVTEMVSGIPDTIVYLGDYRVCGPPRVFIGNARQANGFDAARLFSMTICEKPTVFDGTVCVGDNLIPVLTSWVKKNREILTYNWHEGLQITDILGDLEK